MILRSAIFAVLALAAGLAQSQQYPTKPVRIIAPFAPGGGTDFIARLIAQKLTERLGHLVSELFLDMAKIKIVHIPYKGTGPALNDTIAGSTQLIFGSVSTTLQFIKSGRLRGLAVTTPRRISALPDLPTVAEAGVPGYEVVLWHGLVAPKGVPRPIVDRLNREANEVLKAKDMGDLLATDGVAPAGGTPEQFRAVIKADIERWRGVVKQANIKVD